MAALKRGGSQVHTWLASCPSPVWSHCVFVHHSTGEKLAGGLETLVIQHAGLKIGLMGLIEEEWLATLATIDPSEVKYTDFVASAKTLEKHLREVAKVDIVVALTHMRAPNDRKLCEEVPTLDLVLGGHDHDAFREMVGPVRDGLPGAHQGSPPYRLVSWLLTSAHLQVVVKPPADGAGRYTITWEVHAITAEVAEDPEAAAMVEECAGELSKQMEKTMGYLGCPLDMRFSQIRTMQGDQRQ